MVVLLTREMFGQFTRENFGNPSNASKTTLPAYPPRFGRNGYQSNNTVRKNLLDFMMSLRTGVCGGVRVRLGRLSEMINTSMIESLDFLVSTENSDVEDWHQVSRAVILTVAGLEGGLGGAQLRQEPKPRVSVGGPS